MVFLLGAVGSLLATAIGILLACLMKEGPATAAWLAKKLVLSAAAKLPEEEGRTRKEEWLAELDAMHDMKFVRLLWALSVTRSTRRLGEGAKKFDADATKLDTFRRNLGILESARVAAEETARWKAIRKARPWLDFPEETTIYPAGRSSVLRPNDVTGEEFFTNLDSFAKSEDGRSILDD